MHSFALADGNTTIQRSIADSFERNVIDAMFSETDKNSRLRGLALFRLAEMRSQSGEFVNCQGGGRLCGLTAFEAGADIIRNNLSNPTIDFVWTEPFLDAVYANQSKIENWENGFYNILQIASRSEVASEAAEAVIRLKESSDTTLGPALKAIDLAEFAFRNADRELEIMRAKQASGAGVPAGVFESKQQEVRALSAQLDTLETEFRESDAGKRFAQLVSSSVSLERIQNSLDDDEAYARIIMGKTVGYLVFITNGNSGDNGVSITKINRSRSDAQSAVKTLRCAVDFQNIEQRFECAKLNGGNKDYIAEFPVYDVKTASTLFDDIFGGVKQQITSGKIKHLIVQPDTVLAPLPFSALVTTDPSTINSSSITHKQNGRRWDHDYSRVTWLSDSVSISHSVGELSFVQARDASRDVNRKRAPKSFLGFSGFNNYDAETAARVAKANGVDPKSCSRFYQGFADLAEDTNLHTSIIQSAIGGDVVKDSAFTDTGVLEFTSTDGQSQLKDYRIVLFATHGISPSPLAHGCLPEPGLTTNFSSTDPNSDGFLSASDIASDMELGADLVILSACETAVGSAVTTFSDRPTAETFDGLVRAFYFARAQSLLVTHWTLPSAQTTAVFEDLFKNKDLSEVAFAEALRQTQVTIRNGDFNGNSTSHPYFWANFVFVGDGRMKLDL
ncbi:MAG: CHAT domain-containing protein [Robiginitomaculum sp.]|nr:CHAT domain-containing protein [Robiginitomaculum sp.]